MNLESETIQEKETTKDHIQDQKIVKKPNWFVNLLLIFLKY